MISKSSHQEQKKESMNMAIRLMFSFLTVAIVMGAANYAMAITAPSSGGFMYDVYDIGVNKILKGAPGFVIGCGAIGWGGSLLFKSQVVPAVMSILGGGVMLKADSVVTTLGLPIC